jgi:hypothetical protein
MRENPLMRQRMDAAEEERTQTGVDPDYVGGGGSSLQDDDSVHGSAQRIVDLLQERFARYVDGQVSNHVALQRQRDLQTVQSLARLLAPDVAPSNAFDDLSSLSSEGGDEQLERAHNLRRESEDSRLPLDFSLLSGLVRASSSQDMLAAYKAVKRARPLVEDEAIVPRDAASSRAARLPEPSDSEDADAFDSAPLSGPLSSDQQAVFDKIMAKYSRGEQLLEIVHGMPGTGKTVTWRLLTSPHPDYLQVLAHRLRDALGHDAVLVTAPTGKAAALHPGGMTLQAAFHLGIKTNELLALTSTEARDAQHELHDRRSCLFCDEYGMCEAHVFALTHWRYKQLYPHLAHLPWAGRHVLLFGDPFQLPPVGTSLFDVACNDALQDLILRDARTLIRRFTQHTLTVVLRARDPFWVAFLRRLCDPLRYPKPLTRDVLQPTCEHCTFNGQRLPDPDDHEPSEAGCPPLCPHRCQHFKELNDADVARYPEWRSCKVVAPHNSTVDRFSLVKLRAFARERGQVVIRWRLPLTATEDRASAIIGDAEADELPQLFGYFVRGVPVRLSQNANTRVQFAHGSAAVLHSLALANPRELASLLRSGHFGAGDVLTLPEPPAGVFVHLVDLRPDAYQALLRAHAPLDEDGHPLVALPSKLSKPLIRNLEFGKDQHGALVLRAHDPGYVIDLASTIHGVQGDTIQWLTADFNEPVGMRAFYLSSVYVSMSRVPYGSRFRVAPWNQAVGKHHLLDMSHNPSILRYLASFDERTGAFDLRLLHRALQAHPFPEDADRRRRRALPTVATMPSRQGQERRPSRRRNAEEAQPGSDEHEPRRVRPRDERGPVM